MAVEPIVVDDSSPTIFYTPFSDTFGTIPNFPAGWNALSNFTFAGFPIQVSRNMSTVHATSRDGASVSINFQGTGIQLLGSVTNGAAYDILLDGLSSSLVQIDNLPAFMLASVRGLPNINHTISLTTRARQGTPLLAFDRAVITSETPDQGDGATFTSQSIEDSINLRGQWSTNSQFHQSNTAGDTAQASFMGSSLQIRGRISPDGGDYAVTLQNITSQYSARSSFIQDDTLLFYAGGLDPNAIHSFELVNKDGGSLVLAVNGTTAFAVGSPNPTSSSSPTMSPTLVPVGSSSSNPLSKGTIAALVLAGILGFLLITGILFYLFVYRPRRRHQKRMPRTVRSNARFSNEVLDIGPRSSGGRDASDFQRWKREVEGQNQDKTLGLGLVFSHTPSPKEKALSSLDLDSAEEDRSARSFSFTPSSNNRSANGSNKSGSLRSWLSGKRRKGSSPSTPSYNIDLPPLQTSAVARSTSEPSAGHIEPRSSFSGITSLSYISSSSNPSRRFSFNRPGAASSPNLHERTDSQGLLLLNDTLSTNRRSGDDSVYQPTLSTQQAPQVFVHEVASSYDDSEQSSTRPRDLARSLSARTGSDADRGSVRTYDDSVSVLGASTARAAIRGLSPRTSEATFATFGIGRRGDDRLSVQLDRLEESPAAPAPPPPLPKEPSRERLLSDTTLRPDHQGRFIDVRTGSPFRVDLEQRPSLEQRHGQSTGSVAGPRRMSVRFEEGRAESSSGTQRLSIAGGPKPLPLPPKALFRLTPQPRSSVSSPELDSPSFLDLEAGSSSASQKTGNQEQPSSPSRYSASFSSHPLGGQSRWSSTTPSSHGNHPRRESTDDSQSSRMSATTSPSYNFPFPVSLPASPHHPEGHKPSPPVSPSSSAGNRNILGRLDSHTNPVSPVESVPVSISDLTFRHSDSDDSEGAGRSIPRLPPHPPLPSMPPTPTQPSISQTTPRPAYVVSRLMGSGTSTATPANPVTPANAPTRASALPAPTTALSRHTHSRSLSSDLLSPLGRRPLGPRDSKH